MSAEQARLDKEGKSYKRKGGGERRTASAEREPRRPSTGLNWAAPLKTFLPPRHAQAEPVATKGPTERQSLVPEKPFP